MIYSGKKVYKWDIHPGFETQGRCHQKSKTEVSVAPRKGLMSPKIFLKKNKIKTSIVRDLYKLYCSFQIKM